MNRKLYRLECYGMVEDAYKIWFASSTKSILCEVDKRTKNVKILAELEKGKIYSSIEKVGQNLILIPNSASAIVIYDLLTTRINFITFTIPEDDRYYIEQSKFWKSFSYKNYVYILPLTYPAIIRLNINTMKIEYLTEWLSNIKYKINENEVEMKYFMDVFMQDKYAWLACGSSNTMVQLELDSCDFSYFKVNTALDGFGAFTYDGEKFWITEHGALFNRIISWNPDNEKVEELTLFDNQEEKYCPVCKVVDLEKKILVFPYMNSSVYEVDKIKGSVIECKELRMYFVGTHLWEWQVMAIKKEKNIIKFVSGMDFVWHEYDCEKKTCIDYEIKLDESNKKAKKVIKELCRDILLKKSRCDLLEEKEIPLQGYVLLDYLNDFYIGKGKREEQTKGKTIYRILTNGTGK